MKVIHSVGEGRSSRPNDDLPGWGLSQGLGGISFTVDWRHKRLKNLPRHLKTNPCRNFWLSVKTAPRVLSSPDILSFPLAAHVKEIMTALKPFDQLMISRETPGGLKFPFFSREKQTRSRRLRFLVPSFFFENIMKWTDEYYLLESREAPRGSFSLHSFLQQLQFTCYYLFRRFSL